MVAPASIMQRGTRRVGLLGVVLLVASTLAVACGGGGGATGSASAAIPTTIRTSEAVVETGVKVKKVPSVIGDCKIEPGTQCPGADLQRADLGIIKVGQHPDRRPANLAGGNFRGADFTDAFLEETDFTGADLSDAVFRGANMRSAFLFQADLRGADLTNVDLSFADTEEALFDDAIFCNTIMPDASINNDDCP